VADQILALLKEDGLILSPKMDIAIARLQTQFTIVTVRGDTLLAKCPKDTTAFDGREICIVVRSSDCCKFEHRNTNDLDRSTSRRRIYSNWQHLSRTICSKVSADTKSLFFP